LQVCANPCNARFITRNEQVSGSSPLVGSLFACKFTQELKPRHEQCRGVSSVRQQ
jgi:hypothetical protein